MIQEYIEQAKAMRIALKRRKQVFHGIYENLNFLWEIHDWLDDELASFFSRNS